MAVCGATMLGATLMMVSPATADQNVLHTVNISPATNQVGCAVTSGSCTPHYVTVSSPPDSWPANATVAVAECNFGGFGDAPDPGLCDNRAGHPVFTKTDPDGGLTQLYDANGDPTGAPIKIQVVTGAIGVPSPVLGGTDRPDAICAPPDSQRNVGRQCGIVVAQVNFATGTIDHLSAAALWFKAIMTTPTPSGASNVDITVKGDHFGTLKSGDPIVCAANGMVLSGGSCLIQEGVRLTHDGRLIGAAIAAGHGNWTTTVHIPPRTVGSTYRIDARGIVSGLTRPVTYTVTS